jgi:TPR repeat protein
MGMQSRRSVRLCLLAAAQGHVRALMNLGNMFRDGQGVDQNYAEAVRLYRLAAAQGCAEGQASLGYMFFQGSGTAKDYAEAVRLLRLAAAQGHSRAQCSLGIWLLSICPNLARDPEEGVTCMRNAATNGNARAQLIMGSIFEQGAHGFEVNRTEAIRWFSLAAAQGHIEGADGLRRLLAECANVAG